MKKLLPVFFLISLLVFSCSKSENEPGSPGLTVTVNTSSVNMTSDGGAKVVEVTANGDWAVTGTTSWCTATPERGNAGKTAVNINVAKDDNLAEDRNAVLTFGDKTVTIIQKKKGALILTQGKYTVPVIGDTLEVEVNHNVDFDVTVPFSSRSWVTQKVEGKALSKTKLTFYIAESTETDKREGMVIIKDKSSDLSDTIKIFQVQKDVIVLEDNNRTIVNAGGSFKPELRTNIDYNVTIEGKPSWIRYVEGSKAVRVDKPEFTVDPLVGDDNREAVIVFTDKITSLADTLVLCQIADGALFLMKSKFEFTETGGIVVVRLKETTFLTTVVEGADWLLPIPFDEEINTKSGLKVDSIRFAAYGNYTYDDRTGRILVKDTEANITDTIKVFQAARTVGANEPMTKRMLWGSINGRKDASYIPDPNNKILVSWRMLPSDTPTTAFDLYRSAAGGSEVKVNVAPILVTNFQDKNANLNVDNTYRLCYAGSTQTIETFTMPSARASGGLPYISISLKETASDSRLDAVAYRANDASVGDLDGDGLYEIIIKRHADGLGEESDDENPEEGGGGTTEKGSKSPVILEAYKLDGTFMWRVVFGPNISNSNAVCFPVADFNGDGVDEVAFRTSEGTYYGDGGYIGDTNNDGKTNYAKPGAYNSEAPEFIAIINGVSGAEIARAPYIAIGTSAEWGDGYFKRANSLRVTAMKTSHGNKMSAVACRGVYGKSVIEAWDLNGMDLVKKWRFDTSANNFFYKRYEAQGNHNLSVGDVDMDGLDELTYGACAIDHDGRGLYTTTLGHGDMLHLGDFDPKRPGLEVYQCFEKSASLTTTAIRDARTGKQIWGSYGAVVSDMGRAIIADIDPDSPGCEMWWYQSNARSIDGRDLGYKPGAANAAIWFSGSLNRQILDGTTIDSKTDPRIFTVHRYEVSSINSTKKNTSFYGDILGDWREEIILPSNRGKTVDGVYIPDPDWGLELKIFSTWYPCDYKFPYLMSDYIYKMSAMNQNVGYNMPTHTGFYLGSDLIKK